jgi:hypothetical protein
MRTTRLRSTLWLTTALGAAGAIAALFAAFSLPLQTPEPSSSTLSRTPTSAPAAAIASLPPLESFEPAWRLPLRRPLVDPPPTTPALPAAAAAKPAAPPVRLVGTIIDARHPRGVFVTGLATVEVKGVGESVGGAKILAVDDNTATLAYNDDTVTLRREKAPFDPTGDAYEQTAADRPTPAAPETKGDGG